MLATLVPIVRLQTIPTEEAMGTADIGIALVGVVSATPLDPFRVETVSYRPVQLHVSSQKKRVTSHSWRTGTYVWRLQIVI